ncbi:MAG: DUF1559 domain-containing protein [Planctomycetales bacterium]|nr:DUF1559 domain-containing protein [Planctomycetales bacterium]
MTTAKSTASTTSSGPVTSAKAQTTPSPCRNRRRTCWPVARCSWERVAFARILGIADHPPNYEQGHLDDFRSEHPGGTNFVRADGSVHYIADGIDQRVYQALATRAGGDIAQETRP